MRRFRQAFFWVIATVVGTLALDRILTGLAGPLPPVVAGRVETVETDAGVVSVVESGDPKGAPVVLVHGLHLGAGSYEFGRLAGALPDSNRYLFVDLPGFGRSGRPSTSYDVETMVDALESVISARTETPPIVVASGQSVPIAFEAAQRTDARRVIAIGPRTEIGTSRPVLGSLLSVPIVGTAVYLALTSRPLLADHLEQYLEVSAELATDTLLDGAWCAAHQPGSYAGPGAWLAGDLDTLRGLDTIIEEFDGDVALVAGDRSIRPTLATVRKVAAGTGASLSVVHGTRAIPHLSAPTAVADHLVQEELLAA